MMPVPTRDRPVRIIFQPSGLRASVRPGTDLVEAARSVGLEIGGACGGIGTCGKCRVMILNGKRRRPVLACRFVPDGPVTVEVPTETLSGAARILTEGIYVRTKPRPNVRLMRDGKKVFLSFGPPLPVKTPAASEPKWAQESLKKAPGGCFGIALDLGTTTLVATLFDLESGKRLAVTSALDPQVALGEDVVTRLSIAIADKAGAGRLRSILLEKLNELIRRACSGAKIPVSEVFDVCAVGNTFMHHNFLNLPLKGLSEAPYSPASREPRDMPAAELGLRINKHGRAFVPPVVEGFLGPDALAGALAAGLDNAEEPALYIDLGTNGEILLAVDGRVLGATTAAGPAFEGAQIECGMRAAEGAVSAVRIIKKTARKGASPFRIEMDVIGGGPPRGLAGSGLVDAVAQLRKAGALDERGTFVSHPLVARGRGGTAAVLAAGPRRIHVSQNDVRNLQLAKAAISAGTRLLLQNASLEADDLDRVLLAGAFGNYLDRESAMGIGLLPPVELHRVLSLGNAASTGAGMMLLSVDERRRAELLAKRIEYVELAGDQAFRDLFVDSLAFP